MTDVNVNISFISEKVSKIRFLPEQFGETDDFLTGSFGVKEQAVKYWKLFKNELLDEDNEYSPKSLAKVGLKSDVTDMEFLDFNNVAVTTSDGTFSLIYIFRDREENNLKEHLKLTSLHKYSCSGLSISDEQIATIGEDGVFNIISAVGQKVLRTNTHADSLALTSVEFVSQKELLTGNGMGVIKVFDTLADTDKPTTTLLVYCEDEKRCNRVTSICFHPTQKHIILAGTEEGSITVFDLRQPSIPAAYLSAHSSNLNEIKFHCTEPSKLYTCSEDGELWLWNQNTPLTIGISGFPVETISEEVPWLNAESAKSNIIVTDLINSQNMAINSFDSFRNKVIAAGDNEAIYLVEQLY